jgi:cytochrome c peroxidase
MLFKNLVFILFISTNLYAQHGRGMNVDQLLDDAQNMFSAISRDLTYEKNNKELITLGKKLYFETKLSKNGKISCNSCHGIDSFGVDNKATSPGHDGTRGGRNSPTSFNAALHFSQFWDGREKDVESQALGPLLNPIEHGLVSKEEALSKINTTDYLKMFKTAKVEFNFKNIGTAIGAFERTLITPSRFDDFLNGDKSALNLSEKRGLKKFMRIGCTTCHRGPLLGGTSFQKLGLVESYETKDLGRYEVTKKSRDKKKFKVPTLRNIVKTGPYLHDGSIKDLEQMIRIMGKHQLGIELSEMHVSDLHSFFGALTAKEMP